jgi:mannosyltransferase
VRGLAETPAVMTPSAALSRMTSRRDWTIAIVALITVAAAALRFATLGIQSVWLDEAMTVGIVGRGLGGMLSHLSSTQTTPPLYFTLVWAWTRAFGHGVVAFRAFSALMGTLTIPLLYVAGSRFTRAVGVWAAAFGAVSAELFYYSQEARPYSLFILLSVAALVVWQSALRDPRPRTLALWSALSILALLTHYFGGFVFFAELAVLLRRVSWRRLVAPVGAYALAVAAVAPLAIAQATSGQTNWISHQSLAGRVAQTGKEFLIGLYGPWELVLAPLTAALVAGLLIVLLRNHRAPQRRELLEVTFVGLAGVGLPVLLSLTGIKDVFDPRNVTNAWAPLAIALAVAIIVTGRRVGLVAGIALCAISVAVIAGTLALPAYQRDDWRGAASTLPPPPPDGRVLVSGEYGTTPLSLYLPAVSALPPWLPAVSAREIDFVFLRRPHAGRWGPSEDSLYAPLPPGSPALGPPAPFRLVAVRRTSAYATFRYLAPRPVPVALDWLRQAFGDPNASIGVQAAGRNGRPLVALSAS